MLGKYITASLATAVAASLSMGVSAQAQQEWNPEQQQAQQERELREARENYRDSRHEKDHSDKTIAEVLEREDRFSKFNEALDHADMTDRLDGSGNFTVFAPTNEAIERLPEGTWDEWTNGDNQDQLREVLSYHIVEERHSADDFSQRATETAALNGENLNITNTGGNVRVNFASVSHADIEAENGYIHGIDTVLMNNQDQRQRRTGE